MGRGTEPVIPSSGFYYPAPSAVLPSSLKGLQVLIARQSFRNLLPKEDSTPIIGHYLSRLASLPQAASFPITAVFPHTGHFSRKLNSPPLFVSFDSLRNEHFLSQPMERPSYVDFTTAAFYFAIHLLSATVAHGGNFAWGWM